LLVEQRRVGRIVGWENAGGNRQGKMMKVQLQDVFLWRSAIVALSPPSRFLEHLRVLPSRNKTCMRLASSEYSACGEHAAVVRSHRRSLTLLSPSLYLPFPSPPPPLPPPPPGFSTTSQHTTNNIMSGRGKSRGGRGMYKPLPS
jgi:hypothetical protein